MEILERSDRRRGRVPSRPPARARQVFVVDDDDATLALLGDVVRDAGLEAHTFRRLADLRRALRAGCPNVVILDDELPDGRGGDLARELRQDPDMRNVEILVCTAAHERRIAEIGTWAPVLAKPFDLADLQRFLAGHAERNSH